MIQALDRLAAICLIVVLLFVIPTFYQFQRQEDISYQSILLETQRTADLICELGYLEENSLSTLKAVLGASGASYKITLTHLQKNYKEKEADQTVAVYYIGNYTQDIYAKLKTEGRYAMDLGDFFYLSIENTSKTPFQQLKAVFGLPSAETSIVTKSGGLVRSEGL